ncbi:MAG TPA: helix-turn-helix domain-containing protein [Jatrophihabitantaceae bacterium]|jgi:DNA-binding transcriptional ArsR family regulator|nr:helix-turn-helix domain-containing protein [Jatrophihabitantaceae bacterium]
MSRTTARAPRRRVLKPRVLTDPRAIRALAHPARLTVLEALSDGEELTATDCAAVAGITPSAMSYHLRALERWGFVERVHPSADGRERPWRATASGWHVDAMPDAVAATAATAVVGSMLDRLRADVTAYFPREHSEPKRWRDVAAVENQRLWLTADEAAQLQKTYKDFVEARRGRTATDHPEGARRVRMTRILIPLDGA